MAARMALVAGFIRHGVAGDGFVVVGGMEVKVAAREREKKGGAAVLEKNED